MTNLPSVSVYIPTHNRESLLHKAILSVINQTYQNIEVIVVNDGSTDNTAMLLKRLSSVHLNLKVLTNNIPKGAAYSRNMAIKQSTGEFITGLDDDDEFLPNRIEQFISYSGSINSFLFTNYCEDDGQIIINNLPRKKSISLDDIKKRNYIGNQIFIKRTKLLNINGFDEALTAWEDYDLWLRLIKAYGEAFAINNLSYKLNVDNHRLRISNSNNITLAAEDFIKKHSDILTDKEKAYQRINAIYDSKSEVTFKSGSFLCVDIYSTVRVLKAFFCNNNSKVTLFIYALTVKVIRFIKF